MATVLNRNLQAIQFKHVATDKVEHPTLRDRLGVPREGKHKGDPQPWSYFGERGMQLHWK